MPLTVLLPKNECSPALQEMLAPLLPAGSVFADPEKLTDIGLGIPQITRFMLALKKRGIDVRTDIFTVEQARNEILRISGRSLHA